MAHTMVHFFPNSKFVFPKEDTGVVSDTSQKDLPTDGKYEGFAEVNDAIITDLKTLLAANVSTGTVHIPRLKFQCFHIVIALCMSDK